MDLRSFIAARIAQLPPRQKRKVERVARHLPVRRGWVYDADGLATVHHSPFLEDPEFTRLYDQMAAEWYLDEVMDVRWRMWLLTRYALHARNLPGNYAEFGVYRGGCSRMMLAIAELDPPAACISSTPSRASRRTSSPTASAALTSVAA